MELRVVQYGVTRERLAEIADDGDGWDVLHLSGHGAGRGVRCWRTPTARRIWCRRPTWWLLRPARRRVKLAVVSACESAAAATAETLRLLGLTEQAEALEEPSPPAGRTGPAAGSRPRPRRWCRELDCAVVAMRYPVTDEFAIAFGDVLYEHLLSRRQPVDVAVARAVAQAAGRRRRRRAGGVAGDAWGVRRARGRAAAAGAARPAALDPAEQRMAYFPTSRPVRRAGRRRWRRPAPRWRRTAARRRCCCTGWPGGQDRVRAGAGLPAPGRVRRRRVLAGADQRRRVGQRAGRPREPAGDPARRLRLHDGRPHRHRGSAGGVPAPAARRSWRTAACCWCWTTWRRC